MTRILCFGELLLRLAAPGRERLLQTPRLEVQVGGAEANVAVALACLGHSTAMASIVPHNELGTAAVAELRRHGVDTSRVRRAPGRMGLYFLATGALQRPSEVLYDRAGSALANAPADAIDWPAALSGAHHLHLSGVTPALGAGPAEATLRAALAATAAGIPLSFDGNFRAKLWQAWDSRPAPLLDGLFAEATTLFADHRDLGIVFATEFDGATPLDRLQRAADAAFARYPRLARIACTTRVQHDVDRHELGALLVSRSGTTVLPAERLDGIVDRIGAGDAFAAGVLHGLFEGESEASALRLGLACACLKHAIPGDAALVGRAELQAFVAERRYDVRR